MWSRINAENGSAGDDKLTVTVNGGVAERVDDYVIHGISCVVCVGIVCHNG